MGYTVSLENIIKQIEDIIKAPEKPKEEKLEAFKETFKNACLDYIEKGTGMRMCAEYTEDGTTLIIYQKIIITSNTIPYELA